MLNILQSLQCDWFHVISCQIAQEHLPTIGSLLWFDGKMQIIGQTSVSQFTRKIFIFWKIFREIDLQFNYVPLPVRLDFTKHSLSKTVGFTLIWKILREKYLLIQSIWRKLCELYCVSKTFRICTRKNGHFWQILRWNLTEKCVKTAVFGDFCVNRN